MENPDVLHATARRLDGARRHADSDESAQQTELAWGKTLEAEWHGRLVGKFMSMADAARNHAARLEAMGRIPQANREYDEARRLYQIAQRHEKASEECQAESEKEAGELRSRSRGGARGGNNRPRPAAAPPAATTTPAPPPSQARGTP